MVSKIKKMSLGLITISASVIPLIAITSCGSSIDDYNFNIEVKVNPKVRIFDVKDQNFKNINTLVKVFDGLDSNHLENLSISLEGKVTENSTHRIVLTANEGYLIKGLETLKSNEFTLLPNVFEITPIANPTVNLTYSQLLDNLKDINLLKSLFGGIESGDLDNIYISLESNNFSHTVTLTAKDDFHFIVNGEKVKSIVSFAFSTKEINLDISIKNNPIVVKEDIENEKYKTLATLQKLFNGINSSNINNVSAEINTPEGGSQTHFRVILIAREGYKINDKQAILSNEFIIPIVLSTKVKNDVPSDISYLELGDGGYKELSFLQKFFLELEADDLKNIEVTISNQGANGDFQPFSSHKITLIAKEGYSFLDSYNTKIDRITSLEFSTTGTDLIVANKPNPVVANKDMKDENYKKLAVLNKIFTGLEDLVDNHFVNMVNVFLSEESYDDNYMISLIANPGFTINGESFFQSDYFTLKKIVNVSAKPNPSEILPTHLELLDILDDELFDDFKKVVILEKLFSGLRMEDIGRIQITTLNPPIPGLLKQSITLKMMDPEFTFVVDGEEVNQITSIEFTTSPVILHIDEINNPLVNNSDIENENYKTLTTLRKLFIGVSDLTDENLLNMKITLQTIEGEEDGDVYYTVTLTLLHGYIFPNGEDTLISANFTFS
ncbi:MAG: hypothetical protein ACRCXE_03600 [Metamycoplasmataceae bacterium]